MTVLLVTLLLSAACCGIYLRWARRLQILDLPNERSAHQLPTPHVGGAPLFLAFTVGLLLAALAYGPWEPAYVALSGASLLLMLVGVADDIRDLSVRLRLGLYGLCCLTLAWFLLGPATSISEILLMVCAAVALLWSLNLYNFMDGIDGIAAIQCALACGGAALLSAGAADGGQYARFCLLLAASHLGFLFWNWPPARLFMGDAGSVPTGFLLAGLALLGAVQGLLSPACWLILLAAFITDASWTLLWRIGSGQHFTRPHRLHAYQVLSRRWSSHLKVDMLLLAISSLWLLPLAWTVHRHAEYSLFLVILAYLPLLWGMAKVRKLA